MICAEACFDRPVAVPAAMGVYLKALWPLISARMVTPYFRKCHDKVAPRSVERVSGPLKLWVIYCIARKSPF